MKVTMQYLGKLAFDFSIKMTKQDWKLYRFLYRFHNAKRSIRSKTNP